MSPTSSRVGPHTDRMLTAAPSSWGQGIHFTVSGIWWCELRGFCRPHTRISSLRFSRRLPMAMPKLSMTNRGDRLSSPTWVRLFWKRLTVACPAWSTSQVRQPQRGLVLPRKHPRGRDQPQADCRMFETDHYRGQDHRPRYSVLASQRTEPLPDSRRRPGESSWPASWSGRRAHEPAGSSDSVGSKKKRLGRQLASGESLDLAPDLVSPDLVAPDRSARPIESAWPLPTFGRDTVPAGGRR